MKKTIALVTGGFSGEAVISYKSAVTIDNNLAMKITPGLLNQPLYAQNSTNSYIPAIKITFTLR